MCLPDTFFGSLFFQDRILNLYNHSKLNWLQWGLDPHWAMQHFFSNGCFSIQQRQVVVSLWGHNLFMTTVSHDTVCLCVVVRLEAKLWRNFVGDFQGSLQVSAPVCVCRCLKVSFFIGAISVFRYRTYHKQDALAQGQHIALGKGLILLQVCMCACVVSHDVNHCNSCTFL